MYLIRKHNILRKAHNPRCRNPVTITVASSTAPHVRLAGNHGWEDTGQLPGRSRHQCDLECDSGITDDSLWRSAVGVYALPYACSSRTWKA
eukprot:361278-Chlamydomonas_euryale.AAC.7